MHFVRCLQRIQLWNNALSLTRFPDKHQTCVIQAWQVQSVLLAAVKLKVKELHLSYTEKCHWYLIHIIIFWIFFTQVKNKTKKNVGKTTVRKREVTSEVDKNERSTNNNLT